MFIPAMDVIVKADEKVPNPILEKAIKAIGGEEKLKKVHAISWKSKVTITSSGKSGYDVRLIGPIASEDDLPVQGNNLIVVARVLFEFQLHFRIFDPGGKLVEATNEKILSEKFKFPFSKDAEIKALDERLRFLWPPHELTQHEKESIVAAVTSIVGRKADSNSTAFDRHVTVQALDRYRSEWNGDFGDNGPKSVVVLNGNKGWRKFQDNKTELDEDAVALEKRRVYLEFIPSLLMPLKGKDFKLEVVREQKLGDKAVAGIKVTGPDGKDFSLYFDKESGLPVKLVARVVGFLGEQYTQETTYKDYKEFDGIMVATKAEINRDDKPLVKSELTEFKVLDRVDPKIFSEPD